MDRHLDNLPVYDITTQKLSTRRRRTPRIVFAFFVVSVLVIGFLIISDLTDIFSPLFGHATLQARNKPVSTHVIPPTPTPTPIPFNPNIGAVLPDHRVVAFYAVPNAEPTGPAFELTPTMLDNLKTQGAAYQLIDPLHPVQLGIDLVVSVPDAFPGPNGTYSHHVEPALIQSYIDFCKQNSLILFLDLNFGRAPVMPEVNFFLPYLERYTFVHMAIDPEWMFPRHDGLPGINLSNVRASDLNPIIQAVAEIPMKYHVPRKMLLFHQYRPDGDGLSNPYDAGQAEIADKKNLLSDNRVDVIIHIDGVGGYVGDQADKTFEYNKWVVHDMQTYHNFGYGGFKLFYHIERKTLMTPQQVLALSPAPMVVTYGN